MKKNQPKQLLLFPEQEVNEVLRKMNSIETIENFEVIKKFEKVYNERLKHNK